MSNELFFEEDMKTVYRVEQYRRALPLEFRGWTSEELVREKSEQVFFAEADRVWTYGTKEEAYDRIEQMLGEGRFTDQKVRKGVYRAEVEGYMLTEEILDDDGEIQQSEVIDLAVTPIIMYTTIYTVKQADGRTILCFESEEDAEEQAQGETVEEMEATEQEAKSMIEKTKKALKEQAARAKKLAYENEYQKQNVKRVVVKLYKSTDSDIIDYLDGVGSVQGYIKELIRADMAADQE